MCVRTKNSYGCGHNFKETVSCRMSHCSGIERCHLLRDGDCKACKAGGTAVTRGVEGKGRYAKEHKIRSKEPEPLTDVSDNDLSEYQTSPWATSKPRDIEERQWGSPTRRKADHAWLMEHEERQSVSPRNSPGRDLALNLENDRPRQHLDDVQSRPHREMKKLQALEQRSERKRQDRQNSYDSFPNMEMEEQSPKSRSHSYSHRSHGSSHVNSHSSKAGHRTHGSFDSGFMTSMSPYSYGHSPVHDYKIIEPNHCYTLGYGLDHGIRSMVRDAAKWKRV
jgi:hypothetical protein